VKPEPNVDRPIDPDVTRRQSRKRAAMGGTVLSLAVVAYLWLPALVSPSLSRDRIRTATVERGPVDATISASGLVVPAVEQVITSPVEARVLKVSSGRARSSQRGSRSSRSTSAPHASPSISSRRISPSRPTRRRRSGWRWRRASSISTAARR
jgi:hypothetical protein